MTDAWLETTFRVGRYRCTLTMGRPERGTLATLTGIEWQLSVPGIFSDRELADYRAGRNAMLLEASRLTGMTIGVYEL